MRGEVGIFEGLTRFLVVWLVWFCVFRMERFLDFSFGFFEVVENDVRTGVIVRFVGRGF